MPAGKTACVISFELMGAMGSFNITGKKVALRNLIITFAGQRTVFASTSERIRREVILLLTRNNIKYGY